MNTTLMVLKPYFSHADESEDDDDDEEEEEDEEVSKDMEAVSVND